MKRLLLLSLCLWAALGAQAQTTPTYAGSIGQMIYASCTPCHRQGGVGPFTLESYGDALANSQAIRTAVETKHMPPWPPDPSYRRYHGERFLRQGQIDSILSWVDAGSPRGNPAIEPPAPVFSSASRLTFPVDTLFNIPTFTVNSDEDLYRCFVIPAGLTTQQWLRGMEFKPGNGGIVHHMLLYADTTGQCRAFDAADPLPGYTSFGGVGASSATLLGGWVPGSDPIELPTGFGQRLSARADLVLQIHYAPGSLGQRDSTLFRFAYAPVGQTRREVFQAPILNHLDGRTLINGPLAIPANQRIQFHERFGVPFKVSILSVAPHAHLINRDWLVYALPPAPNQHDTVPIIRIRDWHFHWQGWYRFPQPLVISPGSKMEALAWYDNTTNNADNPNNPPLRVEAGEGTHDEMMLVYFGFCLYQAGDENLHLFDSTSAVAAKPTLSSLSSWRVRDGYVRSADGVSPQGWTLRSTDGRLLAQGAGQSPLPTASLPKGLYIVLVEDNARVVPIRFVNGL